MSIVVYTAYNNENKKYISLDMLWLRFFSRSLPNESPEINKNIILPRKYSQRFRRKINKLTIETQRFGSKRFVWVSITFCSTTVSQY